MRRGRALIVSRLAYAVCLCSISISISISSDVANSLRENSQCRLVRYYQGLIFAYSYTISFSWRVFYSFPIPTNSKSLLHTCCVTLESGVNYKCLRNMNHNPHHKKHHLIRERLD